MHPIIFVNKSMVDAARARIAPVTSAMLYGRGVFTTVAIFGGEPFLWSAHWERLAHQAQRLEVACEDCDEKSVERAVRKLVAVNRVRDGIARVILLARSSRRVWPGKRPGPRQTDLVIMTGDRVATPSRGISLAISPYRLNTFSPLTGIKSLNYLERIMSWEEADARDFDEAVMLNERGEIVSATMANIFWAKDGTVHTPALSTGAVPGITRSCLIELAAQHFVPLVEGVYQIGDLLEADEILLTSASLGVGIVTTFDFRTYAAPELSPAATLRREFERLTGCAER